MTNDHFTLFNPVFHSYSKLIENNTSDYDNLCFLNFVFNHTAYSLFNSNNCIDIVKSINSEKEIKIMQIG